MGLVGSGLAGFREARRRTEAVDHGGGRMDRAGQSPLCEMFHRCASHCLHERERGGLVDMRKERWRERL